MSHIRFPGVSILGVLAVVALLAQPVAAADLLIYYTPEGRMVLTNRPPPRDAEMIFNRLAQPLQVASKSAPAPHLFRLFPERTSVPPHRNTSTDPVALAQITSDMSAADMRGMLGAPGRVLELDPTVGVSTDRSDSTGGHLEQPVWMYPGPAPVASTFIWFVNGRVTRVKRGW